jgi:hypothetical protein
VVSTTLDFLTIKTNKMQEQHTTFTVRDPKTNRTVYIPISHKDLRTKTQEEIQDIITAVIEATLKQKQKK